MPGRLMKLFAIVLLCAVVYFGYQKYKHAHMAPQGGMGMGGAATVDAAEVVQRDVLLWNEFSGRLVAVAQAEV